MSGVESGHLSLELKGREYRPRGPWIVAPRRHRSVTRFADEQSLLQYIREPPVRGSTHHALTSARAGRYLCAMTVSGLPPGSLFAQDFRIVRRLGEGGMGRVFVAEQVSTGALRALKLMHPVLAHDDRFVRRFEQEAKIGANIRSDHIVHVVAAGFDRETSTPWLAMELLEGERLGDLLERRGALDVVETQEVMSQLCHGLAAAHAIGVVHRDLKPDNIFLAHARREGVPFTLKLLDFGIAKVIREVDNSRGEALGSVLWMAPEQTVSGSEVLPAADVWALGLLAFRMLVGRPYWKGAAHESASSAMVLREVVLDPIVPASMRADEFGFAARIPGGFDEWFDQCVAREVPKRFAHAGAAKAALMHVLWKAGGNPPDSELPARPSLVLPEPTAPVLSPRSSTLPVEPAARPAARPLEPTLEGSMGSAVLPEAERSSARASNPSSFRRAVVASVLGIVLVSTGVFLLRRNRLDSACAAEDAAACRSLCDLARASACVRSGDIHARRSAAPGTRPADRVIERRAAVSAWRAACERGQLDGCTRAGVALQQGVLDDPALRADEAAGARLLRKACDEGRGDAPGCVQYGIALRTGSGTGRNVDNRAAFDREAVGWFKLDCDPARGGKGCFWLGYLYQFGDGGLVQDSSEAMASYQLGCGTGGGDPEACRHLAEYSEHGALGPRLDLSDGREDTFPHEPSETMDRFDQARRLWEAECRAGDPRSCQEAAMLLWEGKSEAPAPERAAELLTTACDMGHAPACHMLHVVCDDSPVKSGEARPPWMKECRGAELLRRACDGRSARGCVGLGELATLREDKERAYQAAESIWSLACDHGTAQACRRLALLYAEGAAGIARNPKRAMVYFDRGCERGDGEACTRIAHLFRTGAEVSEKRPDLALANYTKACSLLHGQACYYAAMMLRAGDGGPPDLPKAAELLDDACDLQDAQACLELGRMQGKQDPAAARRWFTRGCEGCHAGPNHEACAELGAMLVSDKDPKSQAHGRELLERACKAGVPEACRGR